ncbi:neurogenic locus notch-like, partial [Tropilaelaps mercedesae]
FSLQSFKSIRYPERYPPSLRCHYQIQPGVHDPSVRAHQRTQRISKEPNGKERPTTVLLTFAAFQVGTRNDTTNSCLDDYLELNLGDGDRTLKLCGYLPEGHQVMAYQTSVWINFVSMKGGYRGFSIKYQLFSAQQLSTVLSVGEGGSELRPLNYPQPVPAHLSQLSVKIFSGAGHRIEFVTRNYTGRHMGNLKKIIFQDPFAQYRKTQKALAHNDYNRTRRSVAASSDIPTSQWQRVVYIPSDGNASTGLWSNPESNMDSTSTELVTIKSLLNGMVINYEPQDNLLIRYKVEK